MTPKMRFVYNPWHAGGSIACCLSSFVPCRFIPRCALSLHCPCLLVCSLSLHTSPPMRRPHTFNSRTTGFSFPLTRPPVALTCLHSMGRTCLGLRRTYHTPQAAHQVTGGMASVHTLIATAYRPADHQVLVQAHTRLAQLIQRTSSSKALTLTMFHMVALS